MNAKQANYTAIPFPRKRQMIIEGGRIGSNRHSVSTHLASRFKELIECGYRLSELQVPEISQVDVLHL